MATNQNGNEHSGNEDSGEEYSCDELEAAQLTAYALGQLQGEERTEVEQKLTASLDGLMQCEIRGTQSISAAVSSAGACDALPQSTPALRDRIKKALNAESRNIQVTKPISMRAVIWLCAGTAACFALVSLMLPAVQSSREAARRMQAANRLKQEELEIQNYYDAYGVLPEGADPVRWSDALARAEAVKTESAAAVSSGRMMSRNDQPPPGYVGPPSGPGGLSGATNHMSNQVAAELADLETRARGGGMVGGPGGMPGGDSPLAYSGRFQGSVHEGEEAWRKRTEAVKQELAAAALEAERLNDAITLPQLRNSYREDGLPNAEQYDRIVENAFLSPLQQPLSTFSIDVDTASYANMRRFLTSGRLPPRNSVRIEELVNYFRYEYPQPKGNDPFSVNMEVAECPWRAGHLLLRVGLKGKEVQRSERPASNLVFLLDVSGSMSDENKLPLLKTAMKMLVSELGENDRVSLVTYAGDAGLKLKSTRGDQQQRITRAIDSLSAGGSTNGSAGIELAYEQATANFIRGGTNRVILCTDGDLNVGITSDEALTKLIKQKATSGVFLTVLGFGEGNLKDAKMEKLADNGNGLYAYIDSVREARKVLVEQLTGSTITIAKDVKIQIEFNPAQIAAYRLLGYENRVMAAEDFNNDKTDAGEIGAGHTVTALYELVPTAAADEAVQPRPGTDPLKYQGTGNGGIDAGAVGRFGGGEGVGGGFGGGGGVQESGKLTDAAKSGELLTLKLRYKEPDGETSKLLEYPLKDRGGSFHSASADMQFAAAVASFGMILRGSQHRGSATLGDVAEIASAALGKDAGGYRAEFVDLVHKAKALGAR